jgi:hypothetical protein
MNAALAILAGALAGADFCQVQTRSSPTCARAVLVLAIACIAAICVVPTIGSVALADLPELLAALVFSSVALFALRGADGLLAAAYLGHGL